MKFQNTYSQIAAGGLILLLFVGVAVWRDRLGGEIEISPTEPHEAASPERVRVASVEDSITFVADSGQRIRFVGVRTPLVEPERHCFGEEALLAHEALVGEEVRLEVEPIIERSRDGAWLRYVYLEEEDEAGEEVLDENQEAGELTEEVSEEEQPDSEEEVEEFMINERILEGGFGFLLASEDMKYGSRLQAAARYASATGKGLWSRCNPYQDSEGTWQTETLEESD